jgi:anti-anti-sigma factor
MSGIFVVTYQNARDQVSERLVIGIEQDKGICILRIAGRLATGGNEDCLETKAREIRVMGCPNLLMDLRELNSIGSSGISFIVGLYTSVTRNSGRLVLAGPSRHVLEVLNITRLSTIIPITADLAAGIAFFTAGEKSVSGGVN